MSGLLGGGRGGDTSAATQQAADQSRKQALIDQINSMFDAPDAKANINAESTRIGDSLRSNYTSDLKDQYDIAHRNLNFAAARAGQTGSTTQADQEAQLNKQNELGSTKIDDAVRGAQASLAGDVESRRNNAINLVNAGSGPEAVNAATTGLNNAIQSAASQQKQDLFTGLFKDVGMGVQANNANSQNATLAAYMAAKGGGTYFPTPISGGGARIVNY